MVDIVGLNNNSNQPNRIDKTASKNVAPKNRDASDTSNASGARDTLDISSGVREAQSVKRLVAAAQAQPDVRAEVVQEAKQKLANGGFEGREVSKQTAEKILLS